MKSICFSSRLLVLPIFCLIPVLAARPMPTPPTPADAAKWREQGRTLPTPELLQPTLDAALPAYRPRTDVEIAGHFKGAASDVLAALTKKWIAAFQKIY